MVKNHSSINSLIIIVLWSLNLFTGTGMAQRNNETVPIKVGAVLDITSGTIGRIGLSCINMSLSDFYLSHSHYKTRIQLTVRNSHKDVVTSASQGDNYPSFLSLLYVHVSGNKLSLRTVIFLITILTI